MDSKLLNEWADDFEEAAKLMPTRLQGTILMTRAQECREAARAQGGQGAEPIEIRLGLGDKLVADIYAEDGSWHGVGFFQPEGGETRGIGVSDGVIDGSPISESRPLALIKSDKPESLLVVIEELQQALKRMGYTHPQPAQQGSVPEDVIRQCEDAIQYASEIRGGCISGVREAQKRVRAILDTPQTAVPDGEERLTEIYRCKSTRLSHALNNLRSEYHNRTAELETEIEDLQAELQRVRRQPAVPDEWRECLAEMVQAMHDYEMSVEEDAPYKHRAMMDRAHALLSTTPQADGWVRCEDRLPTEADADADNNVWVYDKAMFNEKYRQTRAIWWTVKDVSDYTHWMPTGLKRPQPPKEGEGDE